MSEEFVKYLQDNGTIILPKGAMVNTQARHDSEDEWSDSEDANEVAIGNLTYRNLVNCNDEVPKSPTEVVIVATQVEAISLISTQLCAEEVLKLLQPQVKAESD